MLDREDVSRCLTCGSDEKNDRYLVTDLAKVSAPYECPDPWHDDERHPGNCICPDHSDEPYQEQ